jgi:hypothetical protein
MIITARPTSTQNAISREQYHKLGEADKLRYISLRESINHRTSAAL